MTKILDVIVIGAGPIGIACAIEARRRGLDHLVLEKGCLLQSIANFPMTMTFFSTSDRLEIGDVPFVSSGPKPTRAEALEYYRRVRDHWDVKVRTYEEVKGVRGAAGDFTVKTGKGEYRSRAVILAVGFYGCPNMLHVPGEDLPKVTHYYREPFPYVGQKVLVVGGGNSAADAALETFRHGAEVTIATRGPALDDSVKYWVRPDIENRIAEGGIRACFETSVVSISEEEAVLETPDGPIVLENDFVIAMTGYHPDFAFLDTVGVTCTKDAARVPIHDAETYESSVSGIYVAGVMCNGLRSGVWLIENSRGHARGILEDVERRFSGSP